MLKSISMHKRDSKGTIQSDFVTSYLAFKGSIPTTLMSKRIKKKKKKFLRKQDSKKGKRV